MVGEGSGEGRCTHLPPYGSNRGYFVISPPPDFNALLGLRQH